jgi:hypothetical protein
MNAEVRILLGTRQMSKFIAAKGLGCVLVVCALCAGAGTANAQPAITAVSGTVTNNQTISISGTGFGAKGTAAPLVWEDFADGALDPNLPTRNGAVVINSDNLRHAFSSKNARSNYKTGGYYFGYDAATAPKWFVQYWIKLAANWRWGSSSYGGGDDGLANIKFFRMFPSGSRTYANVGYSAHGFTGGDLLRFVENGVSKYLGLDTQSFFTPNAWHNVQVEYGENSGAGQANGTMRLWIDGVLRDSTTTLDTNPTADGSAVNKRPYIIGFYDSWSPSDAPVSNMYAYYGDIYVDNSWARVELGNAATYAACTHREMLLPSAWSAGAITARVAQGSFAAGQPAYVYVVDSAGRVNATGYRVTIGGTGSTAPAAPTGLRIVK